MPRPLQTYWPVGARTGNPQRTVRDGNRVALHAQRTVGDTERTVGDSK